MNAVHGQAVGGAAAQVGDAPDVLIPLAAVGGGDGLVRAVVRTVGRLGEGDLDDLEAGGGLSVLPAVEGGVPVLGVGGNCDRCAAANVQSLPSFKQRQGTRTHPPHFKKFRPDATSRLTITFESLRQATSFSTI